MDEAVVNNLLELAIIVGSIFLTILSYFLKDRKPIKDVVEGKKDIYEILNKLRIHFNASRVAILYTENGGGIPKVNTPLYSSVEFEVVREGITRISDSWSKRSLDANYIILLHTIMIKNHIDIIASELPKQSILSSYYTKYKVKRSFFCPITDTTGNGLKHRLKNIFFPQKKFYYLSISWTDEVPLLDQADKGRIFKDVNDIKKLLCV